MKKIPNVHHPFSSGDFDHQIQHPAVGDPRRTASSRSPRKEATRAGPAPWKSHGTAQQKHEMAVENHAMGILLFHKEIIELLLGYDYP